MQSREIKFRAWSKTQHIFISPLNVTERGIIYSQYIDLKDIHGVNIYEGDIVLVSGPDLEVRGRAEIVYEPDFARFSLKLNVSDYDEQGAEYEFYGIEPIYVMEVIGNIYENPGLLEYEEGSQGHSSNVGGDVKDPLKVEPTE